MSKGNIYVCGMKSEAAIIGRNPNNLVVVSAGDRIQLSRELSQITIKHSLVSQGGALSNTYDAVISFGVCGALNPAMKTGQATTKVLGSPVVISTPEDRAAWFKQTGMDAVDNETDIAQGFAKQNGLTFFILRVVLDTANQDLPPAALIPLNPDGSANMWAIVKSVAGNWGQIPALLKLKKERAIAYKTLSKLQTARPE